MQALLAAAKAESSASVRRASAPSPTQLASSLQDLGVNVVQETYSVQVQECCAIQALIAAAKAESSASVRRAFAQATAGLASPLQNRLGSILCTDRKSARFSSNFVIQALLAAAKAESSASVRRAFAQATAQVAKHAAEPPVAKLFAK